MVSLSLPGCLGDKIKVFERVFITVGFYFGLGMSQSCFQGEAAGL